MTACGQNRGAEPRWGLVASFAVFLLWFFRNIKFVSFSDSKSPCEIPAPHSRLGFRPLRSRKLRLHSASLRGAQDDKLGCYAARTFMGRAEHFYYFFAVPYFFVYSHRTLPPPWAEGSPLMAVGRLYICSFSACRKNEIFAKVHRTRGRGLGHGGRGGAVAHLWKTLFQKASFPQGELWKSRKLSEKRKRQQ